jgi:hypothetical protein
MFVVSWYVGKLESKPLFAGFSHGTTKRTHFHLFTLDQGCWTQVYVAVSDPNLPSLVTYESNLSFHMLQMSLNEPLISG